jgi:plastocyanin
MKMFIALSFLLMGSFFLGGCSLYSGTSNGSMNISPTPTSTTEMVIRTNKINIESFVFNPEVTTIKKGSTVTWTNNDSVSHQIKSDSFNSPKLANGQKFSFTFNNVGTFDYSCSIHPSMTGRIIVE